MSSTQITHVHVGDTRTIVSRALQQKDTTGTLAAVNLTGLTVEFKLLNKADGTTTIAATSATVVTAASGHVSYDLSTALTTAGIYRAFFIVADAGETDHFPVNPDEDLIYVHSDTQTALDAYQAAVAAL